ARTSWFRRLRRPPTRTLFPYTTLFRSRVGGLSALGLSLPDLLHARASAPAAGGAKAKSCIVLFLMGGPPQHSTWDPKPDAPPEIDRKSTRLNSSHLVISYAVFCLKKKR